MRFSHSQWQDFDGNPVEVGETEPEESAIVQDSADPRETKPKRGRAAKADPRETKGAQ